MEIEIASVATGWRDVIRLFASKLPNRIATRHGVSFDIPGLTVWLKNPGDLTAPQHYRYPELIKDYKDRMFGDQRESSLLYQRLRHWVAPDGTMIDQLTHLVEMLRENEHSRSAVFSVWRPDEDISSSFPVSPISGAFRIIKGELLLLLTARSVDVWTGLVPELLTFAHLTSEVALDLRLSQGRVCYHAWSAHFYELDALAYLSEIA